MGRMFTEGKWNDLDAPISTFLPELANDTKGAVTLRQLMSHTSGIKDARDENGRVLKEWNTAKDWLAGSDRAADGGSARHGIQVQQYGPRFDGSRSGTSYR